MPATNNIRSIAPMLAQFVVDFETDSNTIDENSNLTSLSKERISGFYKYLGRLHDSKILKITATSKKFSLRLNDISTLCYAEVIAEKNQLTILPAHLVFPVEINFEVSDISFYKIGDNGELFPIEQIKVHEYLYEQIISINDAFLTIGIIFWKKGLRNNPGEYVLAIVNTSKIEINEMQENAWRKVFNNKFNEQLNVFKSQFNCGRFLGSYSSCIDFYNEFYD